MIWMSKAKLSKLLYVSIPFTLAHPQAEVFLLCSYG